MYIADTSNHRIRKIASASYPRFVDIFSNINSFLFTNKCNLPSVTPTSLPSQAPSFVPSTIPSTVPSYSPSSVATQDIITTVVGSASGSYSGDGGDATSAALYNPAGLAFDASGRIIRAISLLYYLENTAWLTASFYFHVRYRQRVHR